MVHNEKEKEGGEKGKTKEKKGEDEGGEKKKR